MAGLLDMLGKGQSASAKKTAGLIAELKRAKTGDARKEALEALGEWGDPEGIAPLVPALADEDSKVRFAARWALGKMGRAALQPCITALQSEDTGTSRSAASVLEQLKDPEAVGPLMAALADPDFQARSTAVEALTAIRDRRAIPALIEALADDDMTVRINATNGLVKFRAFEAVEALAARVDDESEIVRDYIMGALGQLGDERVIEVLEAALQDDEARVQKAARKALSGIQSSMENLGPASDLRPDAATVDRLLGVLDEGMSDVKVHAIQALSRCCREMEDEELRKRVSDGISGWLNDQIGEVRHAAAEALGEIGEAEALRPLARNVAVDVKSFVQIAAAQAMGKIDEEKASELLCQMARDFDREEEERNVYKSNWFGTCSALGEVRAAWVVPPLLTILDKRDFAGSPSMEAAEVLGSLRDKRALEPLIKALDGGEEFMHEVARKALREITGEFHGDDVAAWRECMANLGSG